MFTHFVGRSGAQCMALLEQMLGRPPADAVMRRYDREINAALESCVTPVHGIEQALARIDIPTCVASSGSYEKMHTTLGATGLLPVFRGRLFSTADVARGKPHPDIYLHAAANMGVTRPHRCVVVEDSPAGVSGGVAAGMTVLGFCELMPCRRLQEAGAHRLFQDMGELPDILADLASGPDNGDPET